MFESVSTVLVGIGGYGATYSNLLLNEMRDSAKIVAVVDPYAAKAKNYSELKALGLPFYDTFEEFYKHHSAELAIISTPINLHCSQTCTALEHGTNVLCEKPLCALVSEAEEMLAAQKASALQVAIGYQWSFSKAIQELKRDILAGKFGRALRFKTMVLWPRTRAYYKRNNWAGALKNAAGEWVLDSPANNACAHYLHNMLYLLGDSQYQSAKPLSIEAELYRANPISNYDTAAFRIYTEKDIELLFYTTHASSELIGPIFQYEFENGRIDLSERGQDIIATFSDGKQKNYGNPDFGAVPAKVENILRAVRDLEEVKCGLEASMMQTICINEAMNSCPNIQEFPKELLYTSEDQENPLIIVKGLTEIMKNAWKNNCLPNENEKLEWLIKTKKISI